MTPLIQIQNLEKSFPTRPSPTWVLRQIQLEIEAGEFVTLMGPSGAGKSTLLSILGLFDSDWEGMYRLDGQEVQSLKPKERAALNRRLIGFVFQRFHLLEDLTVAENLDAPLSYRDLKRPEREARVADALDRFGIVGKKDLYPAQLSGGQQQLVAVARAVIAEPKILLADEPTGNLHTEQGAAIMDLFERLNREGTTIIQVTHSEANAARSRRVLRMRDGWIERA